MRRMPWAVYLWPGLPQLWVGGSWRALLVAVGAAILLNGALLAGFGWSELITADLRRVLGAVAGFVWCASAVFSVAQGRRLRGVRHPNSAEETFVEALDYYLLGDYFRAERVLSSLLQKNVRDLDARLMLATLLRRTGRLDEAAGHLDRLTKFEGVEKWDLEIRRERDLLAEASSRNEDRTEENARPHSTGPPAEMTRAA